MCLCSHLDTISLQRGELFIVLYLRYYHAIKLNTFLLVAY